MPLINITQGSHEQFLKICGPNGKKPRATFWLKKTIYNFQQFGVLLQLMA